MSEKQWREILLSELRHLRVVCRTQVALEGSKTRDCGAVIEIPVEELPKLKACPVCGNPLRTTRDPKEDPSKLFVEALDGLSRVGPVTISFVLPVEEPPKD